MSSLDLVGIDWLGRGWLLILAFTAAVLVVAAVRKPCRHLFGTERAFQLWLLPPLAMLASQLPHAADASVVLLPPVVYTITSAVAALPARDALASVIDWRVAMALLWLAGIVASLLLATFAQACYRRRLRGALPVGGLHSRWPVLRANRTDVGPALVGAWRARIVLPADFEQRYDAGERALILAHETAHARRRDGWWCLLARILAALCWFHPLAWWALAALRHDQELACDAAVLREHGEQRRRYVSAMLKTQSAAFALPVGCTWSPRHPLTERIAMLKSPCPSRLQRNAGTIAGFALIATVVGSVYAAAAPLSPPASPASATPEYQLDMTIELSTDDGHKRHSETEALALCLVPGKTGTVSMLPNRAAARSTADWKVDATVVDADAGHVRIDLVVTGADGVQLPRIQLRGPLGKPLRATGGGADGTHAYAIDVTPQAGCPARVAAEASPIRVTEHVKNGTTRAVAESVAAKAGWTLVNPDALGNAPITLSFNDMPAGTALQQVADLAGMKLVFEGKQVRFEPK